MCTEIAMLETSSRQWVVYITLLNMYNNPLMNSWVFLLDSNSFQPFLDKTQPQLKVWIQVTTSRFSHKHLSAHINNISDRTLKKIASKNKASQWGVKTEINRIRISYLDSWNYSTLRTGRQLSHLLSLLLLSLFPIICSPDNIKN